MSWQQIKFTVRKSLTELCAELLESQGALSVTYQDAEDMPVFEPLPGETLLWQSVEITGLFAGDVDIQPVFAALNKVLPKESLESLVSADLEEQNWTRTWLKYFKPLQFGESLWIIPDGFEVKDTQAKNIFLDPGLAFGTGTHPTTALCLEWLDGHSSEIEGKTVTDYGCGSGVLAVAASLLGAKSVLATDIDPQALVATQQNAEKNEVFNIKTLLSEEGMDMPVCDVLIANILAGPLLALGENFAQKTKQGGNLVLSGLLESQADSLLAYYRQWFEMDMPVVKEGWVRLTGKRR